MPSPINPMEILIIGGGLAGLALGQGLKQAGIPFRIFERDTSAEFRAQGYRIRLGPEAFVALHKLLPHPLLDAFDQTCANIIHGGNRLDANTGEATEWNRAPPTSRPGVPKQNGKPPLEGKSYNADRAVLRSILLFGLEKHIEYGKKFDRYEIDPEGAVIAHFADGTSHQGCFLVGADGIRSHVRRQLLPELGMLDTEGRAVFGKTVITDDLVTKMASQIGNGIAFIAPHEESRIKLFTDGMRWNRKEAAHAAGELDIEIPPDYIYWVLVFREDVVSDEVAITLLGLSNSESAQLAVNLTASWDEKIRILIDHQQTESSSTLAFLTCPSDLDAKWQTKGSNLGSLVTLVGDSAHPMPPVGGVGANVGFQDAADLCEALTRAESANDVDSRKQIIETYENMVLQRAKPTVDRIAVGAGHFFRMRPLNELKPAVVWH